MGHVMSQTQWKQRHNSYSFLCNRYVVHADIGLLAAILVNLSQSLYIQIFVQYFCRKMKLIIKSESLCL